MRHKKEGRKFGRVKRQREALLNGLLSSLIMNEKITTTEAKAKEVKSKIDRVINKAKKAKKEEASKVAIIREAKKDLSSDAVKKLSSDFVDKFEGRNSGYTRVIKLSPRKSDSAKMAVIEFV